MSIKALELGAVLAKELISPGEHLSFNSLFSKGLGLAAEAGVTLATTPLLGAFSPVAGLAAGMLVEKAAREIGKASSDKDSIKDAQDTIQNTIHEAPAPP